MGKSKSESKNKLSPYPGEYKPAKMDKEKLTEGLSNPSEAASEPQVNISENEELYTIELVAPGLTQGDFLVKVVNNNLFVYVLHKAVKKKSGKQKKYNMHGFDYTCFKSDIPLPENADADFVRAEYKQGILKFSFPKAKTSKINNVERIVIY